MCRPGRRARDQAARTTLLDIIEERYDKAATIIATQIPVEQWHNLIGESTMADAILDRLVYASHRLTLQGESLRKKKNSVHNLKSIP
ncbi:ATP-binding protein [Chitinophaga horti]|uniref:ATP-binding protein n=1 Tax=Chitinophaga horti TaxID=2920382 RepID=UPI003D815B6F